MPRIFPRLVKVLASVALLCNLWAQEDISNPWRPASKGNPTPGSPLEYFAASRLDSALLKSLLAKAPGEAASTMSSAILALPMPDGSLKEFRFSESPVMAPELAARYPDIRTYAGEALDQSGATVRFDLTPHGFHAQILSAKGAVYVEPLQPGGSDLYFSYWKRDYKRAGLEFRCAAPSSSPPSTALAGPVPLTSSGTSLRTYRLACAATAEYTAYFQPGTVADGMAAIVTAINRVTAIYESELAIRLQLVPNNDLLVYTNTLTDPYSNGDQNALVIQNQTNLDTVIGNANYDIGHVFGTVTAASAVGCVCVTGQKAFGTTGTTPPVGDAFWVDYVAHEMGHQFGANHTFNSEMEYCAGQRFPYAAFEPGSGSTIMAYAGICNPDNLQPNSDPYFHHASIAEIIAFTTGPGSACGVAAPASNNIPFVNAGPNYAIPKGTPFVLTASASDLDQDTLTFCWEEHDLGPTISLGAPDNGSSPLFRSRTPSTSPTRVFPDLPTILNSGNTSAVEVLPTTSRALHFRVGVRDNHPGGGGFNTADMLVSIIPETGPFKVTSPNAALTWSNLQTVTWSVAGTTNPPVSVSAVNILLSTNGGQSFPILLATNTPNDGSEPVLLPAISNAMARVKVESVGNIFFDISDKDFVLVPPRPGIVLDSAVLLVENCASTNGILDAGESVVCNFALKNIGVLGATNLVATLLSANGVALPSSPQVYGEMAPGGSPVARPFAFTAAAACGATVSAVLDLRDGPVGLGTVTQSFKLGLTVPVTQSFTNSGAITIGDGLPASPYPVPISVAGVTAAVTKVTATLHGFSHAQPDNVDIVLVGPGGEKAMLMSDAGSNIIAANLNLTFDDGAAVTAPGNAGLTNGAYKPANYDTNTDNFPSPAPTSPYPATLSVFTGANPNGNWSLYVRDDSTNGVAGSISNGWSLAITTSNAICCSGPVTADLVAFASLNPPFINVGSNAAFSILISNAGPASAESVVVSNRLPPGTSFIAATSTQGTWHQSGSIIIFDLGQMTNHSTALLVGTFTTTVPGLVTNSAIVASSTVDPLGSNNVSMAALNVNGLPSISAITNRTTLEDTPLLDIPFSIADFETNVLLVSASCSNTNLLPETHLSLGGAGTNRTLSIFPAPDASGTGVITVTVSDGLAAASTQFEILVIPVNDAPFLTPVADRTIVEGVALLLTNVATDIDSPMGSLRFSLGLPAPPGLTLDATNGILNWTPAEADGPGTNLVTVVVADDGTPTLSATQQFTVVVLETNTAPVLMAIGDHTIVEGQTLWLTNVAQDVDLPSNRLLFILATNAPQGMILDSTNGLLSWTPAEADGPGTNLVTVIVTDDGVPSLSATQQVRVVVIESNAPPVLTLIDDQTVHAGMTVLLTASASDPDLPPETLTFSLDPSAPAAATINAADGHFTWPTTIGDANTTNTITLWVSDNAPVPLSSAVSFTITVILPPSLWISASNDLIRLEWDAIPGQSYRLQNKVALENTNWIDVSPNLTATSSHLDITNSIDVQRVFRLQVLP